MDNDLMARAPRPPAEQMQLLEPLSQPAPHVASDVAPDSPAAPQLMQLPQLPELPQWPPAPVSPTPLAPPPVPSPAPLAHEQAAPSSGAASASWAPESRDEVPWDRPHVYDQPTDTATGGEQLSWDKPPDEAWVDTTPMWPPVVNAVGTQQTFETGDPDDAYAPVLGDLSPTTAARTWPETNGHDADRNAATVGLPGYTQAAAPVQSAPVAQPTEQSPSTPWPPMPFPSSASEPLAPHPADAAPAPTQWPLPAQVADNGPAASQWPIAAPPAPDPRPAPFQWPLPEPPPPDAAEPVPALTLWPMAAPPTDYAQHQVGPTPPPELFATAVASPMTPPAESATSPAEAKEPYAPEPVHADVDAWHNDMDGWLSDPERQPHEAPVMEPAQPKEALFDEPEPTQPAFNETELTEAAFFGDSESTEPRTNETELTDAPFTEPHPGPVVPDQPASTIVEIKLPLVAADATATPIVLRIELAIVNDQLRVLNVADSATNVTRENETGRVTSRDSASDARTVGANDDDQSDAAQFMAALASVSTPSDEPTSTVDAPEPVSTSPTAVSWAAAPFVSPPEQEPEPAPHATAAPVLPTDERDRLLDVPWAEDPPTMDPLAAIPALPLVAQPVQAVPAPEQLVELVDETPPDPSATSLAPVEKQPPAPYVGPLAAAGAPAAAVAPAAPVDQNLWFLSTEPNDVDAVTGDDEVAVRKKSSTVLTAVVTIGMAILVLALVLVFFSLMTSLLG